MGYVNSVTKGTTNYALNGGSQFIVCSGGGSNESQYTFTNPTGFAVTDSDFNKSITYRFLFQNCWFSTSSTTTVTLGGKKIMSVQPDLTNSSIDPASNGLIQPLPRHQMTIDANNRYYAITANTVLEMYYDSSLDSGNGAWVIVGNPIVMSASNYTVYANGFIEQWGIASKSSSSVEISASLPIKYTNKNYMALSNPTENTNAIYWSDIKSRGENSLAMVRYNIQGNPTTVSIFWLTKGY